MGTKMETKTINNPFLSLIYFYVCIPIILDQFKKLVGHSTQKLLIKIPNVAKQYKLGKFDVNNNNDDEYVTLTINHPVKFCWKMFLDRKLGLAEAYLGADWDATPGPKDLLTLLIRARGEKSPQKSETKNRFSLAGLFLGLFADFIRKTASMMNYLNHKLRQNTITQARQNIKDHYDLGNDMFQLFLDDSMTYSCGVFEGKLPKVDLPNKKLLNDIQMKKYDLLLERLDLKPTDHVLEIGCGWGACAIRAVQKYGCKWTGLTISSEQYSWAMDKINAAGLQDKIEIKFLDYRKETGKYNKVISIEMIEAVGHEYLPAYFSQISSCLKPNGKAAIQAILIPDDYYEKYRTSSDYIKKYIFPGCNIPSIGAIKNALPKDLAMKDDAFKIGKHYAPTLDLWNAAWIRSKDKILELGYSEYFFRKWEFYFVLCSSLFEYGNIDDAQFTFEKIECY